MTLQELLAHWKTEDARMDRQIEVDQGGFDQVSKRTHIEQLRLLRERTTALETALAEMSLYAKFTKNADGDFVCEHGTAADVHCCDCHRGFIFDDSQCSCTDDGWPKTGTVGSVEALQAFGEQESTAALKAKNREQYQFWAGWLSALSKLATSLPAQEQPIRERLIQALKHQASENGCYGEIGGDPCFQASPETPRCFEVAPESIEEWCPYCLMHEAARRL